MAAAPLGIAFIEGSTSTLLVQRDGKNYLVDVATHEIREVDAPAPAQNASSSSSSAAQSQAPPAEPQNARNYYIPGNDRLFTLPTGSRLPRNGMAVSFTHRFPYEAAFTGVARGHTLLGMDDFGVSSFGFQYGVTSRLSVTAYRAPSIIGRPIELMAAYSIAEERAGHPLNATVRFSVDVQNDFQRNFTTNFEAILSRSITSRAAFYLVPTFSYHNRAVQGATSNVPNPPPYQPCGQALATGIPTSMLVRPCANTFALGVGLAVDVRPTVAIILEVDPTLANAQDLGIHRAPFSFGIQKKIWRHAFTFGFTTAPGTTVAQRIGTLATYLHNPKADDPSRLFVGFNLSRQMR
ncbi:MAG: DUF5777 family beta-barrel protein [Acidobacteriia bacterium]|nr:DUF5777 family beta-barrel protein [Terriglobia bacterium]